MSAVIPGFTSAMKNFFGLRAAPHDKITDFAAELKNLSYEEKMEFHKGLLANGIACRPPDAPKPTA